MTRPNFYREQARAAVAVQREPMRIQQAVGARCIWGAVRLRGKTRDKQFSIACIRMQTFY